MNDIANDVLKVAKSAVASEEVLARNESYWSWEYDQISREATIYVNSFSGDLRMKIIETHIKSGLGAGTRTAVLEDTDIGNIVKPKLGLVVSLLKKHSFERSRAGGPFSRLWHPAPSFRENASLGDILKWKFDDMQLKGWAGVSQTSPAPVVPVRDVEDDRIQILRAVRQLDPSKVQELLKIVQGM